LQSAPDACPRVHRLRASNVLASDLTQSLDDGADALGTAPHVLQQLAKAGSKVADLHLGEGADRRGGIPLTAEARGALGGRGAGLELRGRRAQGREVSEDGLQRGLDLVGSALGELPE